MSGASSAEHEPQPGRQPSTRLLLALLVAAAAVVALSFVLVPRGEKGDRVAIRGIYVLVDFAGDSVDGEWDACSGEGKYDDYTAGVEVSLTDEHGVTNRGLLRNVQVSDAGLLEELNDANGFFDGSHMAGQAIVSGLEELSDTLCVMLFDIEIPVSGAYKLTVSDWVDRPITYEKIQASGFTLLLTRGANIAP